MLYSNSIIKNKKIYRSNYKNLEFIGVKTIDSYGLYSAFYSCIGITSVSFPELTSISERGLQYAFHSCIGITSVSFPELTTIGTNGLYNAFSGCTGIVGNISFPKLTTIGTKGLYSAFASCTGVTELHFRADAQATIEAASGYSNKFGATNATVYFDL